MFKYPAGNLYILRLCNQIQMKEVEILLTKQVQDHETPSAQYLIFNQNKVIDRFTTGLAQIENDVEANESTTYNAFSVTKTFTALAVLQLAEQHKIDLQAPVINYLAGFPYSSKISIIQLLSHTSGIPNPIPLSWIHLPAEHPQFASSNFFARVFSKNRKLKSLPGRKFAYSNLGYVFLGRLIEKASGLSYEEFIVRNIITRLDLKPSELSFRIHDPAKHAKGYHKIVSLSYAVLGFLIDKTRYFDKQEGPWKSFKNYYVNGASLAA